MSSDATQAEATAKQAPTEQQESQPGAPRRLATGQTVCNEKNEKGKLCNGHLKQLNTQHPSGVYLRGDDVLHRCQACGALYMGPPMGHVRDPSKQQRYVERDLAAILQAAGGTLPAYDYPTPEWRGEPRPKLKPASKPAPALTPKPAAAEKPAPASSKPAPASSKPAAPAGSSPSADAHRPAAEAQAATGEASAAPLSPTAATASPASGAETVADLAPAASTERTPAAPRDERAPAAEAKPAPAPKKKAGAHAGFKIADEFRPQENETPEQKIARLKRLAEEAKRASGKL